MSIANNVLSILEGIDIKPDYLLKFKSDMDLRIVYKVVKEGVLKFTNVVVDPTNLLLAFSIKGSSEEEINKFLFASTGVSFKMVKNPNKK